MEPRSTCEKRVQLSLAVQIALAGVGMLMAGASPAADDLGDMDISELVKVRLSPFDVAEHLDQGYRASNSVSGSRFDAPIRELPFAIQAFTEQGAVVIYNVQSGEQRSRGLELDATIQPGDGWQLYLSYSFMDARIVEFSGRDDELLARDPDTLDAAERANYKNAYLLHGARLQMSAPHIANLWARRDFGNGAYVGGGFNFVKDQTLLPDSEPRLRQSYTLWNALAGYAWTSGRRRYSIEVIGKNLGNERYRPSQSTRARPREMLATLKVEL